MKPILFEEHSPNILAFETPLKDLRAAIRSHLACSGTDSGESGARSERAAEVLDYVLRHRTLGAFLEGAGHSQLEELSELISQATHPRREAEWSGLRLPYPARWDGFRALLDTRIEQLASRDPEGILKHRAHAREIVAMVLKANREGEKLALAEVRKALGLKSANMTRIMGLLVANGLVGRHKVGNGYQLIPGEEAIRLKDEIVPVSASDDHSEKKAGRLMLRLLESAPEERLASVV